MIKCVRALFARWYDRKHYLYIYYVKYSDITNATSQLILIECVSMRLARHSHVNSRIWKVSICGSTFDNIATKLG